jgi:glutathione synthase/RimK-type ligase-like ATP-grasp enzyme
MRRIAYLTCASYRGQTMAAGELPPAEADDFGLQRAAAESVGLAYDIVRWDDPRLLAGGWDGALIRSCWDYHERPDAFLAQLSAFESQGGRVFNASAIVAWNARKTYLRGLGDHGAPTIDTLWPEGVDAHGIASAFSDLDAAEIVVKPQIGAGSRRTIRLKRNAWSEADLIDAPQGPAMIQPFLPSIVTEGEYSLFLFGGKPAHAIAKKPKSGGWYANVDDPKFAAAEPTSEMMRIAEQVAALAPDGMLYARIDLVRGLDGALKLIELEAIEPYLFLRFAPWAAGAFAAALADALG